MTHLLILLALAAGYAAFRLVKPHKACRKCSGWGQKTRRRRRSACTRCGGTGKTFPLTSRLVHKGTAAAMRRRRERSEGGRLWREVHGRAPVPGRPAAG